VRNLLVAEEADQRHIAEFILDGREFGQRAPNMFGPRPGQVKWTAPLIGDASGRLPVAPTKKFFMPSSSGAPIAKSPRASSIPTSLRTI